MPTEAFDEAFISGGLLTTDRDGLGRHRAREGRARRQPDQPRRQGAAAGAIEPLVALVRGGSERAKEQAAAALRRLAFNNADNKAAIVAAGGLPPLIALLSDGTPGAQEHAAAALMSLALNADNQAAIAAAGGIAPLIELVSGGSAEEKTRAAAALRGAAVAAGQRLGPACASVRAATAQRARSARRRQGLWSEAARAWSGCSPSRLPAQQAQSCCGHVAAWQNAALRAPLRPQP